jgi:predicted small integral membrane protein
MNSRLIKILFAGTVGLYLTLACLNNVLDYRSNFEFVSRVATMEDTFSPERNGWRSVRSVLLHHLLFVVIILWEATSAFFLLVGTTRMIRHYRALVPVFRKAKAFVGYGLVLGVLLWFGVFIALGGEWFLMWQSKTWNAQTTAFLLTACFLLFLIYHQQEDS